MSETYSIWLKERICEYDIEDQHDRNAQQRRIFVQGEKKNEDFILLHLGEINL